MRTRLLSHMTYPNVVATLCLFVALGGTSYAALTVTGKNVKNGSLTGADIKNGSITSADVANLRASDFTPGQLPRGDRGPQGAQGPAGAQGPSGGQGPSGPAGEVRGYARVDFFGHLVAAQSRGVLGVTNAVAFDGSGPVVDGAFCFDLAFTPATLIGEPIAEASDFGSKVFSVSTAGPNVTGVFSKDNNLQIECPASFQDAAVAVHGENHLLYQSPNGLFVLFT